MGDQSGHFLTHFRCIGTVGMAIIPHDRIHENQGIILTEAVNEACDNVDLFRGTEETRGDSLEAEIQFFPLCDIGGHMHGIVCAIVVRKSGMIAEDRGGNRAALHPHGRDDGKLHRNRAAAKAGVVIDQGDFVLMVMVSGHYAACLSVLCAIFCTCPCARLKRMRFAAYSRSSPGN